MRRRWTSAGLVVLLAAGLAACGDPNAGTATARALEEWMAGTPHLAEVHAGGSNTLPFAGEASGRLVLEPDVSAAEALTVVERALAFDPGSSSLRLTMEYVADGFVGAFPLRTRVDPDTGDRRDDVNRARIDAVVAVAGTGATSLTLTEPMVRSSAVEVDVQGGADFLATFDEVAALTQDLRVATLISRSPDDLFSVTATDPADAADTADPADPADPADADDARDAYAAVLERYTVTEAHLEPGALMVRVDAAPTGDVEATALAAAPGVAVEVQFGAVTVTGDGDVAPAQALLKAAGRVTTVEAATVTPESLALTVADTAAILAVEAALSGTEHHATVLIVYSTSDGVTTVWTALEPVEPAGPLLTALAALGTAEVTRIEVTPSRVDVETDLDPSRVAELGAALALTPPGRSISVVVGPVGFRVPAGDSLDLASVDVFRGEADAVAAATLEAFVDGWNAAP